MAFPLLGVFAPSREPIQPPRARHAEHVISREAAKRKGCGKAIIIEGSTLFKKPRKSQEVDTESVYSSILHHWQNTAQPMRQTDSHKMANEGRKDQPYLEHTMNIDYRQGGAISDLLGMAERQVSSLKLAWLPPYTCFGVGKSRRHYGRCFQT
jgi:hypothetical protein